MAKFEAVSTEELYWRDEVAQFRGQNGTDLMNQDENGEPLVPDESREIDMMCEAAKELVGREVAAGFKDAVHMMKYTVGKAPTPEAIDAGPEGGVRELVAA